MERVLEIVHLTPYAERLPNQMSGGQQQRVALARALVAEPKLLLLDEPLSNLDAKLRETMRFEIKEIQKRTGITVVYVTHDQTEAMAMSDRIFVINRGAVQQEGTPQEIYNHPSNPFVADFLGKVDFFRGEAGNGRIVFPKMGGQSLPWNGTLTGKVLAAIRPENFCFSAEGGLKGQLETQYYLGDVNDCRVRIGGFAGPGDDGFSGRRNAGGDADHSDLRKPPPGGRKDPAARGQLSGVRKKKQKKSEKT